MDVKPPAPCGRRAQDVLLWLFSAVLDSFAPICILLSCRETVGTLCKSGSSSFIHICHCPWGSSEWGMHCSNPHCDCVSGGYPGCFIRGGLLGLWSSPVLFEWILSPTKVLEPASAHLALVVLQWDILSDWKLLSAAGSRPLQISIDC